MCDVTTRVLRDVQHIVFPVARLLFVLLTALCTVCVLFVLCILCVVRDTVCCV